VIRLSELVSALTPAQYAELSLVLFLLVFAGVLLRHGGKRRAAEHAACAQLPLADDAMPDNPRDATRGGVNGPALPVHPPEGGYGKAPLLIDAMPLDHGVSR
jgi:cbb3-type cytochrome oxidase subunit 3